MLYSIIRQYFCKNTKNIQKVEDIDGFCWQGEPDLNLFYEIEGYFDNLKSLMTVIFRCFKIIMTLNDFDPS